MIAENTQPEDEEVRDGTEGLHDPIADEYEVDGEKFCTHCGVRKRFDEFHRDIAKDDGRRDVCKECRKVINEEAQKERLAAQLQELEEQGLATLGTLSDGGSFDPHINEVFEAMLRPFGGVNGWAKHLYATYLACKPGSHSRVKMHDMMLKMAGKVTQLGLAERQLDMMEEKDLLQVMRHHIVEYQKSNDLPASAVPTSSGKVIDAYPVAESSDD